MNRPVGSSKPAYGGSKYNEYHALCVVALAKQALSELPPPTIEAGSSSFRIGIVTPYRAQAQKIRRLLAAENIHAGIRVGTVHTFQGLECEMVIFDTVESSGTTIYFTRGGQNSQAMRLVNVAVTRPQHKLIIVANRAYLSDMLDQRDTLWLAVEEARKAAVVASSEVL